MLESYFHLFVNSSSALQPKHDLENLALRTISTHVLGQYVGTPWGLGRAMRWTPTIAAEKLEARGNHQALLKSVGLYKVQGDAVAAVMGGIFFQFVRLLCPCSPRIRVPALYFYAPTLLNYFIEPPTGRFRGTSRFSYTTITSSFATWI